MNEELKMRTAADVRKMANATRDEYLRLYPKLAEVKLKVLVEERELVSPYMIQTRLLTIWNQMVYSVEFSTYARITPWQYAGSFSEAMDTLIRKLYTANCYIVPAIDTREAASEKAEPREEERRRFEL